MVATFEKGLNMDFSPEDQPQGTYRMAWSAVNSQPSGKSFRLTSELGTELCFDLPTGYTHKGTIFKNEDSFYVFSSSTDSSEIGVVEDCEYTTIINDSCLNFTNRIDGIYRLRRGCEDTVYFTDGDNPVRVMNLSDIEQYYTDGEFDCSKIALTRPNNKPTLEAQVLDEGGTLEVGSYFILLRYLDEERNPTEFVAEVGPFTVYRGTFPFDTVYGGFTLDADPLNGVADATKSIEVITDNLDERFSYYQIGVAIARTGSGIINDYFISPEVPIVQSRFVIDGQFDEYTSSSLEEFRLAAQRINQADHITSLDSRLLLANLRGKDTELCDFQKYASKIETYYTYDPVGVDDVEIGNSKQPGPEKQGYMGGEVYAFGIVYVFEDGEETPVFHIPGRPKDTGGWVFGDFEVTPDFCATAEGRDTTRPQNYDQDYSFRYTQEEWEDLAEKPEIWTLKDTSQRLPNTPIQINNYGYMSYYEVTETYPEVTDCQGGSIWGVDACGNELVNTPIRHHKFPTRDKISLIDDDEANVFGVRFDNIELPPGVTDYYFVRAKRREKDKTVLDKGVQFPVRRDVGGDNDLLRPAFLVEDFTVTEQVLSPVFRNIITPEGVVNTSYLNGDYIRVEGGLDTTLDIDSLTRNSVSYDMRAMQTYGSVPYSRNERIIDGLISQVHEDVTEDGLQPTLYQGYFTNFDLINDSPLQEHVVMRTDRELTFSDYVPEVKALNGIDRFNVRPVDYIGIVVDREVYDDLYSLEYVAIGQFGENSVKGGDTIIGHLSYATGTRINNNDDVATYYLSAFMESTINSGFKTNRIDRCDYTIHMSRVNLSAGNVYSADDFKELLTFFDNHYHDDTGERRPCEDVYEVNPDYSPVDRALLKIPLSFTYDCCSECREEFPQRWRWSEVGFQEELVDNYRVFLPNNYRDLPGERGPINNIFVFNDNLYLQTESATYQQPRNIQERLTDELTTFIGTGEFGSLPPRIMVDDNEGTAGIIDKYTLVKSRFGVIWYDRSSQLVASITDGLNMVSDKGLRFFWEQEKDGEFQATYDPMYRRYVITKTEFEEVQLKDQTSVRANRSFTVSYDMEKGHWVSFHPYLPDSLNNTQEYMYSSVGSSFYRHGTGPVQEFYGDRYPFIIDSTLRPDDPRTATFLGIVYRQEGYRDGVHVRDVTFDKAVFYNSRQSTGLLTVINKLRDFVYFVQQDQIAADKKEHNWSMNDIRDLVTEYDGALFSSDWIDIEDSFPIDKVVNSEIFSAKNWFNIGRLRDKYMNVRLFYTPTDDTQITLYYIAPAMKSTI
jgi:hypothetical protein